MRYIYNIILYFFIFNNLIFSKNSVRILLDLNEKWIVKYYKTLSEIPVNWLMKDFNPSEWQCVSLPHNLDQYFGYRRLKHGNLHGYALYRKSFTLEKVYKNKRFFLYFEGVGSYAHVWVNGIYSGYHAGGRTSFTIDITDKIVSGENLIALRADHPPNIKDLPWVCGGCSDEWGFSEGSQPFGIFRPVFLLITNDLKIEPFGIHVWNDTTINKNSANLFIKSEIKNYSNKTRNFFLAIEIIDKNKNIVCKQKQKLVLKPQQILNFGPFIINIIKPKLWYPHKPYLYKVKLKIIEKNIVVDEDSVFYGIRKVIWPSFVETSDKRLFINDSPVFINGTSEYEHLMGKSHSFSDLQIKARVMQIKSAGFNAFRDAHQPHNLRYQKYCDSLGVLWWPQFSAHIWFENEQFKNNFKQLLIQWIKERRNSPSVILWGLQNESVLPEEFSKECVEIIRQYDPTASIQRKITTCNGGKGTDWNVLQNWSGTYGGNPFNYDKELKKQLLNAEYGAWRSIDLHSEGYYNEKGIWSEDRMCHLMELKIRLAENTRDSVIGHFHWLFASHENPGRIQNGEGYREIDRLGPVNYKGLFTIWGEPLDAYYLYRSIYASKYNDPVVYIVSQTWPERWITQGIKDSIIVFSNCDSVLLYNDIKNVFLGSRKRNINNYYFQWDSVFIKYGLLYAEGYVNGKVATTDMILLNHLPLPPEYTKTKKREISLNVPSDSIIYIYRVNCGGPDYIDEYGNLWMADQPLTEGTQWGSYSWSQSFNLPWNYGSQRRIFNDINGTRDIRLFQTFRYGTENLFYWFSLPDTGTYYVELYFIEPWYGKNNLICKDWRVFDIAINDSTVENNFDIWKETGYNTLLKKVYKIKVYNNKSLKISFPKIQSGQAVISAIAIATKKQLKDFKQESKSEIIENIAIKNTLINNIKLEKFADKGDYLFTDDSCKIVNMSPLFFGKEWIKFPSKIEMSSDSIISVKFKDYCDVFFAIPESQIPPQCIKNFSRTNMFLISNYKNQYTSHNIYYKRFSREEHLIINSLGCYTIFLIPVNQTFGSAVDQRPEQKYPIDSLRFNAIEFEKLSIENISVIKPKKENAKISFDFKTGIGDSYNFRIRYKNINNKFTSIKLKIIDSYLQVVHDLSYNLPYKDNFQSYIIENINLNAGSYIFEVTINDPESLLINFFAIQ